MKSIVFNGLALNLLALSLTFKKGADIKKVPLKGAGVSK